MLVSTGAAEVVLVILAMATGLPLPLTAVQLLWLNLVTQGIQDVSMGFEPGDGVDVAMEMAGSNQALNTAISSTRAGGDIVLFGLSEGDYTLSNFQEIIMHGKSLHSVVGRRVFQTWYILSNLLKSKGHDLQDKIYEIILNKGEGTVIPFHSFDKDILIEIY